MQISGIILDVHDDVGGEQLRAFFPTQASIPGFIKSAQALSHVDRERLPDDAFALVLVDGTDKFRKFACIDEGNTALSVVYFLKNAQKLPAQARKVAAENLKVACGWYGLDVPVELEKEAGLGSVAMNYAAKNPLNAGMMVLTGPALVRGTSHAIKDNLAAVRAAGPNALGAMAHKLGSAKKAELSGTDAMPYSYTGDGKGSAVTTVKKTSSVGRLVNGHKGDEQVSPEVNKPVPGKAPDKSPQHMNPVVVVTDSKVRKEPTEKRASKYALPSLSKYPIEDYVQVKMASDYFDNFGRHMEPSTRREYCSNLYKRASELEVPVSDVVRKYGSEKYASASELQVAIDSRKNLLRSAEDVQALHKIASVSEDIAPEKFASILSDFDRLTGLNRYYDTYVMDPYYSTYGFEKKAEESDSWSDTIGNYHVTKRDLDLFALNHWLQLQKIFGLDFAEEFRKDPVGIYSSLPVDQKKLIIRMATENAPV